MSAKLTLILTIEPNGAWEANISHHGNVKASSVIHALKGMAHEIGRNGLAPTKPDEGRYVGKDYEAEES